MRYYERDRYQERVDVDPEPVIYIAYFDGTNVIRKFKTTPFEGCIPLYKPAR